MTNVTIHLLKGRDLAVKDLNSSDPFVRIYVNGEEEERFQSRCKSKTLNPSFNQKFDYTMSDSEEEKLNNGKDVTLILKVFDCDAMHGEDAMGWVTIPLKSDMPEEAVWYPVEKGIPGEDGYTSMAKGDLEVQITITK